MISYPQAGSFAKFLYEEFGRETVQTIWVGGSSTLSQSTELKLEELQAIWIETIQKTDVHKIQYRYSR